MADKIDVENVNHPGKTERVDRAEYEAMRAAMWAALPTTGPGLNAAALVFGVIPPVAG